MADSGFVASQVDCEVIEQPVLRRFVQPAGDTAPVPEAALQEMSRLVLAGTAWPGNVPQVLRDLPGDIRARLSKRFARTLPK